MSEKIIQFVIQGGAIGIAAGAMFVVLKISYFYHTLSTNHIENSSKAMNDLTNAITRLTQFLEDKIK